MSTPIRREDIRKGDKIRQVTEYTATHDFVKGPKKSATYELIERPEPLPEKPGAYQADDMPVAVGYPAFTLTLEGQWYMNGEFRTPEFVKRCAPFTLLRPVAEVAAEVLAEVHGLFGTPAFVHADIDAIAAKWATK